MWAPSCGLNHVTLVILEVSGGLPGHGLWEWGAEATLQGPGWGCEELPWGLHTAPT